MKIHKLTLAAAVIGALALGSPFAMAKQGYEQQTSQQTGQQLSKFDREFVKEAAQLGQAEVALAQSAQQKAGNDETKRLANELVSSHNDANQQLSKLAANKGIEIPNQPTTADRNRIQDIEKSQGDRFDKEFQQQMIKDHRRSISLYQKAAKSASDPDIRSWAQKMVPVLEQHLAMIERPTAVGEAPRGQTQERQRMQQQQQEGNIPTAPR